MRSGGVCSPKRGTATTADHAGGATFSAGTASLGGDQRALFGKWRNTVQQTNQFQPRLANSGVGIGVAGSGENEIDMTTDSEEDSKLPTPVPLTGTPCSRPRSDSASVWASGGDGGLSGNPGVAAVHWERGRAEATTDGEP